ncbi:MAG: outer membrane protein transport protein [Chromatiaceae bacterium]|nr:outer membrane protein transport protein [Chromatiaceae bacterium]
MNPNITMRVTRIARNASGRLLCFTLVASAVAGQAQGAAFSLHENSVRAMGTAYAGSGANAGTDAATIFWNPAGMSLVDGRQVQVGGIYVTSSLDFKNKGSSQSFLTARGILTAPSTGASDNGGTDAIIPNLYGVMDLNDKLKLGLGIYAPFGLSTQYDSGWVGRYHALESSIETISINPALSYEATERLTIGAGVSANYIDAKLTQAVFVLDPFSGRQLSDGHAKISADDWGYAFNAGMIYAFDDGSRVGLAYRSDITHTLDGARTLTGVGPLSGRVGARADLALPESVIASGYTRLSDKWSIMGDLIWTRWSRFEELRIQFDDSSTDSVTRYDWNDSWRFSVGAEYRSSRQWSIRAGLAFDQTPIPNAQRRDPRLPGSDRRWVTIGATYRANDLLRVDFAYAYIKLDDARIDNTIDLTSGAIPGAFTDTLIGSYDSDSHLIGVEIRLDL